MSYFQRMKSTSDSATQAPLVQNMSKNSIDVTQIKGIMVRQETQIRDVVAMTFDLPYEAENKYRVFQMPVDKNDEWHPTAQEMDELEEIMFIQEESNLSERVALGCLGCLNLRPLTLRFRSGDNDLFLAHRTFKFGGQLGNPLEMSIISSNDRAMGKILQDFTPCFSKYLEMACTLTNYTSIIPASNFSNAMPKYTLKRSSCCCGRVNNCFGATCLKPKEIVDILNENKQLVGTVERIYAPGEGGEACARSCFGFVNFKLQFPPDTSGEDRLLLLSAMMFQEYQMSRR